MNLGTTRSPQPGDVRRYLREFLSDPRVLDIPGPARWALLNLSILPRRTPVTAAAYEKIWMPEGSPLLVHGRALRDGVARSLGPDFVVELGMRYGTPSIRAALQRLREQGLERIIALPLFPQHASSSSGSALAELYRRAAETWNVPQIRAIGPFYAHPDFIRAQASLWRPAIEAFEPEILLLSFHGLPERHIRKGDSSARHCLQASDCCERIDSRNEQCYRAQCSATSRALAHALELSPERWSMSFQSRLGRTPWIKPHTDLEFEALARRGVRRLAVACPSFVADCLETLEEIGLRGRAQWQAAGGQDLLLLPCLNAHPPWIDTLAEWIRGAAHPPR